MGYFPATVSANPAEHLALEGGATNTGFILGFGVPARTQIEHPISMVPPMRQCNHTSH